MKTGNVTVNSEKIILNRMGKPWKQTVLRIDSSYFKDDNLHPTKHFICVPNQEKNK